jgi:hypothetical protein
MSQPAPKPGEGDVWTEVIQAVGGATRWLPGGTRWYLGGELGDVERIVHGGVGAPPSLFLDFNKRRLLGISRYGQALQRGDGRDHNVDAYEEALDMLVYLWAARASWWKRWGAVVWTVLLRPRRERPARRRGRFRFLLACATLLLVACGSSAAAPAPAGYRLSDPPYHVLAVRRDHDAACWTWRDSNGTAISCLPCSDVPKVCAAARAR